MNEFVFRVVKPHLYFILAVCDCFFEVFQDYFCIIYTNIKHDVQSGLPVRSQLELEFFKESDVSKWLNLNIYFREFTWCLGHKYGAEQFTLGNSLVPSGEKNWTVWSAAWILHKKRHWHTETVCKKIRTNLSIKYRWWCPITLMLWSRKGSTICHKRSISLSVEKATDPGKLALTRTEIKMAKASMIQSQGWQLLTTEDMNGLFFRNSLCVYTFGV